jgi:hypothetical protein
MIDLGYLAFGFVAGLYVGFKLWRQSYVKLN